MLAIHTHFEDF